jgi:hypothetical protein
MGSNCPCCNSNKVDLSDETKSENKTIQNSEIVIN